jgi:hypothetical protein
MFIIRIKLNSRRNRHVNTVGKLKENFLFLYKLNFKSYWHSMKVFYFPLILHRDVVLGGGDITGFFVTVRFETCSYRGNNADHAPVTGLFTQECIIII